MSSNQSLLKMIFLIRCKHWNTLNSEKEDLFSLENSKDAPKKSNQSKQLEPLKYEKKIRVVCENILQFQEEKKGKLNENEKELYFPLK